MCKVSEEFCSDPIMCQHIDLRYDKRCLPGTYIE